MVAAETKPGANAAGTGPDIRRVVDPGSPGGKVDVFQVGIDRSAPLPELTERIAVQIGTQIQARRQFTRRISGEAEAMPRTAVFEHSPDVRKNQFAGAAHFIIPAQTGLGNHDAPLTQKPIGQTAAFRPIVEFNPANDEGTGPGPANIKVCAGDFQFMQAQLAQGYRPPGNGDRDERKRQCRSSLTVVQAYVGKIQVRLQTVPAGVNPADADLAAQTGRQRVFD